MIELRKQFYESIRGIKIINDKSCQELIEDALNKLMDEGDIQNYKYVPDTLLNISDTYVVKSKDRVFGVRLSAINFDYNDRDRSKPNGPGEHFHIVPFIPQVFEIYNISFEDVIIDNLGFDALLCHEDDYKKACKAMTYKVPASNTTWKIKENNMPYMDITEDLYIQFKHIMKQEKISSFNTYISSRDTFTHLFGTGQGGGFVKEMAKHVKGIIIPISKKLNGDSRLYKGVACSRYFYGVKKDKSLYFSPMGFNYDESSEGRYRKNSQ